MTKTKIEWADTVWNPTVGCSKVSEGCRNCYAETLNDRFGTRRIFAKPERHFVSIDEEYFYRELLAILRMRKPRDGSPVRVFVDGSIRADRRRSRAEPLPRSGGSGQAGRA